MTSLWIALLAVIAAGVSLRLRVTILLAVFAQAVLRLVGLASLAEQGRASWTTFWLFLAGVVALLVGYLLGSGTWTRTRVPGDRPRKPLSERAVLAVVLVAGVLAMYHLIAAGIPILSDSVERDRFDFTSSGLFGIPGRMYLYGTTIAWVLASANATSLGTRWRESRPWLLATAFVVVSAVLSGFKGELLSTAVTLFGAMVVLTGRTVLLGTVVRRYWLLGAVAVGYFLAVASLYKTYQGASVLQQSIDRATVIAAEPVWIALEGRTLGPIVDPIRSDAWYFLLKYSGQSVEGMATLDRIVGAAIIGVSPYGDAWVQPVTVSGFAEVAAGYGAPLALVAMLLAGAWLARADRAPASSVTGMTVRAVGVLVLYAWIQKGGLAYLVINHVAVVAVLLALAVVVDRIDRAVVHDRRPGTARLAASSSALAPSSGARTGSSLGGRV